MKTNYINHFPEKEKYEEENGVGENHQPKMFQQYLSNEIIIIVGFPPKENARYSFGAKPSLVLKFFKFI